MLVPITFGSRNSFFIEIKSNIINNRKYKINWLYSSLTHEKYTWREQRVYNAF